MTPPPHHQNPPSRFGPPRTASRPWLGVYFACCRVYARVYLNREGDAFTGHCLRCGRPVRIGVSDEGTDARFWVAE